MTGNGPEGTQPQEVLSRALDNPAPFPPSVPHCYPPATSVRARGTPDSESGVLPSAADTACVRSPQQVAHMPGSVCIMDGGAESPMGRGWDDFTSSHWVFSPGLPVIPSYRKILSTRLSTSVVLSVGCPLAAPVPRYLTPQILVSLV